MSNDNIIQFPLDKVVRVNKTNKTKAEKQFAERVKQKQTKEFCDTAVDDISMNLLRHFVDLALKTTNNTFTKDLALLIDVLRGLIYRDFNLDHPAQRLVDKLVKININKAGQQSAKIDYSKVLNIKSKSKPLSSGVKEELKDIQDSSLIFDGDNIDE